MPLPPNRLLGGALLAPLQAENNSWQQGEGRGGCLDMNLPCSAISLPPPPLVPGSVTPHNAHVFLKLAAPPSSDPAATDESWWPESVDK